MGGGIIFADTINQGNVEVHLAASPLACPVSAVRTGPTIISAFRYNYIVRPLCFSVHDRGV